MTLLAFSHNHCLSICAVLVPANLMATLQTLILTGLGSARRSITLMVIVSSIYASLMISHVLSWLAVGVVMAPTFVLFGLGCLCLAINGWALTDPNGLQTRLRQGMMLVLPRIQMGRPQRG